MIARLMGLKTISPHELQERMRDGQVTAIDVNARESWLEAHVPGARNADPVNFDAGVLPDDKDAPVVFYCSGSLCRKAPNAARRAKAMGYNDVRVMSAGISGWRAAKLPTDSGD